MKYAIDKKDQYALIRLMEENLNAVKAPDLKSELVVFKNEGVRNLIIDVQDVKYIDSSGLSAILTANRLFGEEGTFVLTGVNQAAVKTLISLTRLDGVITILPTESESIDFVMMSELQRELDLDGE
jgi:anti-sigma B factor antagonist